MAVSALLLTLVIALLWLCLALQHIALDAMVFLTYLRALSGVARGYGLYTLLRSACYLIVASSYLVCACVAEIAALCPLLR